MNTYQILGFLTVICCSVLFFLAYRKAQKGDWRWSLALIVLAGFILRIFVSTDCYLHDWDERFHALVAKNMMTNPFVPMLFENPVLPFDYKDWSMNQVWLSKPILPFLSMSLSLSFFGVNEFALRIPSILFSSCSIGLTFYIAYLLYSPKTALLASFFHAIHGILLELTGGRISADHTDIVFLFWFQIGIILVLLFSKKNESKYLLAFGITIGLSFLCKWIMSFYLLIIFLVLSVFRGRSIITIFKDTNLICLTFSATISPWLLYLYLYFPLETEYIFKQILLPVQEPIQGHEGNFLFYFHKIRMIFGELVYLPLIWILICFYKKDKQRSISLLAVWIVIPLLTLSFCGTKRATYLIMIAPAFFILTALYIRFLQFYLKKTTVSSTLLYIIILCLSLLPIRYSIERIKPFQNRDTYPKWSQELQEGRGQTWTKKDVIFNEAHYINAMFYTNCAAAYPFKPSQEQVDFVKKQGYSLVIK